MTKDRIDDLVDGLSTPESKKFRRKKPSREERREKEQVVKITFDTGNEVVVIAAVIADERARRRYINTPPDYFRGKGHAEMWSALQEIYRRGLEYSPEAVREIAGESVDVSLLDEYTRSRPEAPPNLAFHVEQLRWHKARFDAATGSVSEFLELFRDTTADPDRVKAAARKIYQTFQGTGDLRYLRDSHSVVVEHERELQSRMEGRALYPYGIEGLDFYGPDDYRDVKRDGKTERVPLSGRARMIPGCAPGDITVVAGRSGSGKTTGLASMILSMIDPKSDRRPRKVLWGSWEQGDGDSLELLACLSLGLSRTDIMSGQYGPEHKRELLDEMERLGTRIRFFKLPFGKDSDEKRRYNRENLNLIHQYVAESGCDVGVFDLFHMSLEDRDVDAVTGALYRMKGVADDTRAHLFLVHQIKKVVETLEDPRPTRESLSGTGSWIDVADTVLAPHRPGIYSGDDDKVQWGVLKQRNGPWPMWIECDWDGEFGTMTGGRTLLLPKQGEKSAIDSWMGDAEDARQSRGRKRNRW